MATSRAQQAAIAIHERERAGEKPPKRSSAKKASSGKTTTSSAGKSAKKSASAKRKSATKVTAAKKSTSSKKSDYAKKSTKPAAGKSASRRAQPKEAPAKTSGAAKSKARKYSPAAGEQVGKELHEMHHHQLHIGKSKKLVTNPRQAIAIGLAEARRAGKKVPPNPNEKKS